MQDITGDVKKMADRGLGRGLDSLIPTDNYGDGEISIKDAKMLKIGEVEPNPHQPRQDFGDASMAELAASIREHGILQPLLVTPAGEKYQLIAGERRLRAAKIVGLKEIPAVIRTMNEQSKLELAIIENVQREDLNPIETAGAYKRLIEEFNLTHEEVAIKVGKARTTVANILRLLNLPPEMKNALVEGKLTEGHARALLAIEDNQKRLALFNKILAGGLTVREAEAHTDKKKAHEKEKDPNFESAEKQMSEAVGTKVIIKGKKAKGQIIINYYSFEDLEKIYKRIISS